MNKKNKLLTKSYSEYQIKNKKGNVFSFFRNFMPEIVFRTTKLEGERITRKTVATLF